MSNSVTESLEIFKLGLNSRELLLLETSSGDSTHESKLYLKFFMIAKLKLIKKIKCPLHLRFLEIKKKLNNERKFLKVKEEEENN